MLQVVRKGPIRVATDYPLVAELLTSPAFEIADWSDEASADVLVSVRPVRDFYALPRSVVPGCFTGWFLPHNQAQMLASPATLFPAFTLAVACCKISPSSGKA